jgi:hypothetical protein
MMQRDGPLVRVELCTACTEADMAEMKAHFIASFSNLTTEGQVHRLAGELWDLQVVVHEMKFRLDELSERIPGKGSS